MQVRAEFLMAWYMAESDAAPTNVDSEDSGSVERSSS